MSGWWITAERRRPATPPDDWRPAQIAQWSAGYDGLNWIDELVASGRAVVIREGFFSEFEVRLIDLLPRLQQGPPDVHPEWNPDVAYPSDVYPFRKSVTIDAELLAECDPSEWVSIHATDNS